MRVCALHILWKSHMIICMNKKMHSTHYYIYIHIYNHIYIYNMYCLYTVERVSIQTNRTAYLHGPPLCFRHAEGRDLKHSTFRSVLAKFIAPARAEAKWLYPLVTYITDMAKGNFHFYWENLL